MMRAFVAALSLLLLTACDSTSSLKELRHAPAASDPYQQSLASQYQDYSESKLNRYDWWTSKYFADKGLMAAYGRDTQPEDPQHWNLPADSREEFIRARGDLLGLVAANRTTKPAESARAVVAYDRWLELADDGWNAPAIEEARDQFFASLGPLQAADSPTSQTVASGPIESTSTILYFPFDSDALDGSASAAMDELIAYIKSSGNASVVINGHADRAGGDDYNMTLSERRAQFVRRLLLKAGVPEKLVKYFAFGESDPRVETPDGEREPQNRRVEIYLE